MRRNGTFGDHFQLTAIANIYAVQIYVISAAGPHANTVIEPDFDDPLEVFVGHFPEGKGEHYVALKREVLEHNEEAVQEDEQELPFEKDHKTVGEDISENDNEACKQANDPDIINVNKEGAGDEAAETSARADCSGTSGEN